MKDNELPETVAAFADADAQEVLMLAGGLSLLVLGVGKG